MLIYVTIRNIQEVITMESQQIIGYLITGLWTLVNIGAFVFIIALLVRLYKYLGKSDKSHKGADA